MSQQLIEVANEALRHAQLAMRALPSDASVSLRCNAVTTAVRAMGAYRDVHMPPTALASETPENTDEN